MPANVCPTCNAAIDPARAPVARVRGTRVVTFCSVACADASRSAAPAPPQVPVQEPADRPRAGSARAATAPAPAPAPVRAHDDEQPAPKPRGNNKRRIIALSSTILVGGMVITIINAVSPSTPSDVSAASGTMPPKAEDARAAPERVPPAEPLPPAPATPQALHDQAQATLRALMASTSPRLQRLGAVPLSRQGDAPAIERVRALLAVESSDLGRIELAYALARTGDDKGRKLLLDALQHDRRDVRLYAARHLVQLGDDTGDRVLRRMLSLRNHRIEAAGLLARMGNEDGLKSLREELGTADATSEHRMRVAVALGRAGDDSVKPRLLEILANEEARTQHVGAAEALATLRERAAVPALVHQLDVHALRVGAALALRRLGESGDTVTLEGLAVALETGPEDSRASAAEAILILVGPERVAEFD